MKSFTDIAELYRQLGGLRFTLFFGAIVALILGLAAVFTIQSDNVGWPENYGFTCRRKCLFVHMWHSPKLIAGGSGDELLLFFLIWSIPLATAAIAISVVIRRWLKRRRDRIRPLD